MSKRSSGSYRSARLAELYDHVPAYVSREEVRFFVDEAVASGGPVLELGCGTGRVLLEVARAGVAITGLDLSEHMLDRLRAKLEREDDDVRERVSLVTTDMCDFELEGRFALAMSPFRPFQHLVTVKDQLGCLRCAHRALRDGGRLVLDVFHLKHSRLVVPKYLEEQEDVSGVLMPDGSRVCRTHRLRRIHKAEQYLDVEMTYHITWPDGRQERAEHAFAFRYVFRYEMEHLLARCGFEVVGLFGDFDRSPFGDNSPQMVFVAEKG